MQNFLSQIHESNFKELLDKANVKNDTERESLFYIISGNSELYKNVHKIYDFKENSLNIEIDDESNIFFPGLTVSSSATKLVSLAVQLYNSGNKQTVMETFAGLDENNFILAINAIKMRFKM